MHLFPEHIKNCRVMVFVDGENFAMRYGKMLADQNKQPCAHVRYEKDAYVWSAFLQLAHHLNCDTIRRHYYTAIQGDELKRQQVHATLQSLGIEAPRVFRKYKQRGSKQVDISLTVEMLEHAHRGNYDLAVLVAGDEDYVPLVEAVKWVGKRVVLWFVENGLSPVLKGKVDHYFDTGRVLFEAREDFLRTSGL